LSKEGIVYNGFVFFGLINVDGEPLVIEYNCRMGDPETEVVMPRLKNDLLELFQATISGKLKEQIIYVDERAASTVMLVSKGYPEAYEKNKVITGIPAPTADQVVFHAGTKAEGGNVLTNGGRVLAITSLAGSLSLALSHSVQTAEKIQFDGKVYRRDIGYEFI
jgi:phosphoribosylamine--glycine ligase